MARVKRSSKKRIRGSTAESRTGYLTGRRVQRQGFDSGGIYLPDV